MDIRHAPREAQEVAFEQGLIPYIRQIVLTRNDRGEEEDHNPFVGGWNIRSMSAWAQDYLHEECGVHRFDERGSGEFHSAMFNGY